MFLYEPSAAPNPDEAAAYYSRHAQRIIRMLSDAARRRPWLRDGYAPASLRLARPARGVRCSSFASYHGRARDRRRPRAPRGLGGGAGLGAPSPDSRALLRRRPALGRPCHAHCRRWPPTKAGRRRPPRCTGYGCAWSASWGASERRARAESRARRAARHRVLGAVAADEARRRLEAIRTPDTGEALEALTGRRLPPRADYLNSCARPTASAATGAAHPRAPRRRHELGRRAGPRALRTGPKNGLSAQPHAERASNCSSATSPSPIRCELASAGPRRSVRQASAQRTQHVRGRKVVPRAAGADVPAREAVAVAEPQLRRPLWRLLRPKTEYSGALQPTGLSGKAASTMAPPTLASFTLEASSLMVGTRQPPTPSMPRLAR